MRITFYNTLSFYGPVFDCAMVRLQDGELWGHCVADTPGGEEDRCLATMILASGKLVWEVTELPSLYMGTARLFASFMIEED